MRIFKRLFWSIIQQKSKYLLLLFSSFVLGIVFTGILVLSFYMNNIQNEFVDNYGAQISIYNSKKYQSILMNKSVNSDETLKAQKTIIQMFHDKDVKYGDYSLLFKGIQSEDVRFSCSKENVQYEDIYFYGVQKSEFLDIKNNKIKIVEGRSFSQNELENEKNVLIINKNATYKQNKIKVGDHLQLSRNIYPLLFNSNSFDDIIYSETVDYEVIGLFEVDELYQINEQNTIDNYETKVYVPNIIIEKESEKFSQLNELYNDDVLNMNNSYILGDAFFLLKTSKQLENFEIKYDNLFSGDELPQGYFIYGTNQIYEKISKPIKAISIISNYLLYVSIICCILILGSIIFVVTKNRKKEIGILLSLGEKKYRIFIQVLLEIMFVGLIGLNLSILSGAYLGNRLTEYMIDTTIVDYSEVLSREENEIQIQLLNNYKVDLEMEYIIYVNHIGSIVLLMASTLSLINMLNTSPKQILQD